MSSASVSAESGFPFAKLSVDVFDLIAHYLETTDIQSARLAGRDLHSISSPYLFRAVTFSPHQEYLDPLNKISKDPILSYHTRTLRFDTTLLRLRNVDDPLDLLEWHPHYTWFPYSRTLPAARLHKCEPNVYDEALTEYESYVLEQNSILDQLHLHLSHVFRAFPKLSTITFCNTFMKGSDKFKFALRENSISRKWIREPQLKTLFRILANTADCEIRKINIQGHLVQKPFKDLDNRDFGDDSSRRGSMKYILKSKFDTACYTKEKIPFIYGSSFDLSTEELSMAKAIFSNLTQLSLGLVTTVPLEVIDMDRDEVPKAYWADFPAVLQSLTNVVDLSLDLKIHRSIDQQLTTNYYHDDIAELFESPPLTFPYLKRLKLSQFRSRGLTIQGLLERHPAIKELTLTFIIEIKKEVYDVHVYREWEPDPDWVQCIEVMRGLRLRLLDLRGIEAYGHWYNRFGSENEDLTSARIYDYIMHGYGDNPLQNRLPLEKNCLSWDEELW